MKYSLLLILLLVNILSAQTTFFIKYKSSVPPEYVLGKTSPGKLLDSRLFKAAPVNYRVSLFAKGIAGDDEILGRIIKVDFPTAAVSESDLQNFLNDPLIEYVQKALIYKVDVIPNDSLLAEQWALKRINAFDAWNITEGADTVLLAIIDTGIDYLHPDLKNQIKFNQGEMGLDGFGADKKSNKKDDDGNGFVDDYMGWDFTDRLGFPFDSTGGDYLNWDNDPADEYGHGTYVAGVAAAEANNITGIAGVAPGIKILNIRAFDPSGYGEEDDAAAAILYAVKMGAKVINMSFGDNSFSYVLRDVIRYAYSKNVVLIASSGNSGSDAPHYPSGYSEVISVGNSNENDYISSTSNYGSTLDLVAPGSLVKTTSLNSSYSIVSGTSIAAPFVSGTAALILSRDNFSSDEIRQILKSTSDDVDASGWDLRSGAGRLNLFRALSVTAPSAIKFDYPKQDFATFQDTLKISATVLSAYFLKYELYFGSGITPQSWELLKTGNFQFASTEIFTLPLKELPDSTYTLRLVVYQSNGRTTEERINFYISRVPPSAEVVTIGPALYGNETTVLASVYTDVPSVVKMYYKRAGSTEEYRFVTLDGFATNNQFVKYFHYGFIPKELISPETTYRVYLEAENLTGLKSIIKDSLGMDFYIDIKTTFNSEISYETELPSGIPFSELYEDPVNIISDDSSEILFNGFYPGQDLYYGIYKYAENGFNKVDSVIKNKLPIQVGDFNKDGKTDILSTFMKSGSIEEQVTSHSTQFTTRLIDSSGNFWVSLIEDVDEDGNNELFFINKDSSIAVWKLDNNFNRIKSDTLKNFTEKWVGANLFGYPKVITADVNNNGRKEIWAVDNDGDVLAYEVNGSVYSPFFTLSTGLFGSSEYITSGDFNGDGNTDIAVLLQSIQNLYIAPFNYIIVFDKDKILFQQAILDPSAEFNTGFNKVWNSIRFADLDNDGKDELVTFSFPYAYIFRESNAGSQIIAYKENINSRSVFISDFNKNGVKEVAFPFPDGIKFFEFAISKRASTPMHVEGYSLDSSAVVLSWTGSGDQYFIYKGSIKTDLQLYDSTSTESYTDHFVQNRTTYFYRIQAFDNLKEDKLSGLSSITEVYTHNTSHVTNIENRSLNTLLVSFSEKINTTILDLTCFKVEGIGSPNSVSPETQYSYLLSFSDNLNEGENSLIIRNLKDNFGSLVKEDTLIFQVMPTTQNDNFYISSHEILNPYLIRLEFNLDVDDQSALNKLNYTFEPENFIDHLEIDKSNRKSVYLHLEKRRPVGSVGISYQLSLGDIFSSESSGRIKINSGAGSVAVLISSAADLSHVYVYPNPYKPGGGERKITFAGLPQKAKIFIFTLNGNAIKTIVENNGDGGLEFDLKDDNGEELASGIYLFRIIRLDDANNEVEEKLGKFALIK